MFLFTASTVAGNIYFLKSDKDTKDAVEQAQKVSSKAVEETDEDAVLHCSECHHPITRPADRITKNRQHRHVFTNPHGYVYQIGCFARAKGCVVIGAENSYFSWFPGYVWQIAICGKCLTLLGWAFSNPDSQFFGLIVDKLVEG